MKRMVLSVLLIAIMGLLVLGCPSPITPDPEPIASTIVFADGATVTKIIGSGSYTNTVSGVGDGTITYISGNEATATVNAGTGEVTLVATGTTVITASKAATATHAAVSAGYTLTVQLLTLVAVPAGSFQRDGTASNISVISRPFRMSRYEITREQFLAIMDTDPGNITYSTGTTDPVQMANWYHAIAFCNKLSIAEGLVPVYAVSGITDWKTLSYVDIPTGSNTTWDQATATWTNNGYRLPTEMEWMWAAMGATSDRSYGYVGSGVNTTGYGKAFAGSTGGNAIGDYGWYYTNSDGKTHPAGEKTANELGLCDMTGNVWEWCWDWYAGSYPAGTQTDYRGAASGTYRIGHGGCFDYDAPLCTVVLQDYDDPDSRNSFIGFRVVRP